MSSRYTFLRYHLISCFENPIPRNFEIYQSPAGNLFFLYSDVLLNMGYGKGSTQSFVSMCSYLKKKFVEAGIFHSTSTKDILVKGSSAKYFKAHDGLIPLFRLAQMKAGIPGFMSRNKDPNYSETDLVNLARFVENNFDFSGETEYEAETYDFEQLVLEAKQHLGHNPNEILSSLKGSKLFEVPVDPSIPFLSDMVMKVEDSPPVIGVVANQVDVGTALMSLADAVRELSKAIIVANAEVPEPISKLAKEVVTDTAITWNIPFSNGSNLHSTKPYSGL